MMSSLVTGQACVWKLKIPKVAWMMETPTELLMIPRMAQKNAQVKLLMIPRVAWWLTRMTQDQQNAKLFSITTCKLYSPSLYRGRAAGALSSMITISVLNY